MISILVCYIFPIEILYYYHQYELQYSLQKHFHLVRKQPEKNVQFIHKEAFKYSFFQNSKYAASEM